jgi:hypothetical protein
MPKFLNTSGRKILGIGICDRCKFKYSLLDLKDDIDKPGLKVCADCRDQLDPYKRPQREVEDISLPFRKPDTDVSQ